MRYLLHFTTSSCLCVSREHDFLPNNIGLGDVMDRAGLRWFGSLWRCAPLLAVLMSAGSAAPVVAQTVTCSGSPCTATIPPGASTQPLFINSGTPGTASQITTQGTITITTPPSSSYGVNVGIKGTTGSSSNSTDTGNAGGGGATGAITATNSGAVSLGGTVPGGSDTQLYWVQSLGGPGGNYTNADAKQNAGAGGAAGDVTLLSNTAPLTLSGTLAGAMGLVGQTAGGSGGAVTSNGTSNGLPTFDHDGDGGNGGAAGNVTVVNSGAITIGRSGAAVVGSFSTFQPKGYALETTNFGFRGISATANGGLPGQGSGSSGNKCDDNGSGCGGGAVGGSAGAVVVTNTGPIGIVWDWRLTSGSTPLPADVGFGILAASVGAAGASTYSQDYSGGAGGEAKGARVNVNAGGNVSLTSLNDSPPGTLPPASSEVGAIPVLKGAGVAALSIGGAGGSPFQASHEIGDNPVIAGGTGGKAAGAVVLVKDAAINVAGTGFAGILVRSVGGAGGGGNIYADNSATVNTGGNDGNGGTGGNTAGAGASLAGAASVTTSGAYSPGIVALGIAGAGGVGSTYDTNDNPVGDAGGGGKGGSHIGSMDVELFDSATIRTSGIQSAAIVAESRGGDGGAGGARDTGQSGNAGRGGDAGSASDVNVTLSGAASIVTQGDYSPGIAARSLGGRGGNAGTANPNFGASPQVGGAGGNSGFVYIVLDGGTSVVTHGVSSPGINAVSTSGYGGGGSNDSAIFQNTGGTGGAGGQAGATISGQPPVVKAVQVSNQGRIGTTGDSSQGIVALAMSGGGGAGGTTGGLYAQGGTGSSAGVVGSILVENRAGGAIGTSGVGSHGILASAIGGGGGNGGSLDFANSGIGGAPALSASGGPVTVNSDGLIGTSGNNAHGILAQSIGGGGGNGGDAAGLFSIGGTGGAGGSGGTVSAAMTVGAIKTEGQQAHGINLQSIGGGGGNGGNATTESLFVAVAIGGSGGSGGDGGSVAFSGSGNLPSVVTTGSKSAGIVAKSIGGGGGSGGAAYALGVGPVFSSGIAVGGRCSAGQTCGGGNGGQVTVDLTNTFIATGASPELTAQTITASNTFPVDAFGVFAASIGGGGGIGGSASAAAVTAAIPVTKKIQAGVSVALSAGGSGGNGGSHLSGTNVAVSLNGGTTVTTLGNGSHGVLAMSVGGGGGEGGDSSALAATVGYNRAATLGNTTVYELAVTVAHGGTGGSGGSGGSVEVGVGGQAGGTTATGPASIVTYGDFANGVVAQSIGGGGGNAGFGATTSVNAGGARTLSAAVTIGSMGGNGGGGGGIGVIVYPQASITTYGDGANGIVAQSVGGGGGTSQGGTISVVGAFQFSPVKLPPDKVFTVQPSGTLNITMGEQGGNGGSGGGVTVDMQGGSILTRGNDSTGIMAQSVGHGGGLGGSAGSGASADNPISTYTGLRAFVSNVVLHNLPFTAISLSLSLGSDAAGVPGTGGGVIVNQAGGITTQGDWSTGIHAMSIGGGGGRGGVAAGAGSGSAQINLSAGVTGYGDGGSAGITLTNAQISTGTTTSGSSTGYAAFGVVGQSVGGGGGFAADGSDAANGTVLASDGVTVLGSTIALAGVYTGTGSGNGNGGAVSLFGSGTISTLGEAAHAVVLQSVGGGGGITGAGSSLYNTSLNGNGTIALSVGGGNASIGGGGSVAVNNATLAINTSGANAFGLLAQSIGGGGGLGFTQPGVPTTAALGGNYPFFGTNNGGAVNVTLASGSTIFTGGSGAHAIVLQSVGGGGGIAGYATGAGGTPTLSTTPATRFTTAGNGGVVAATIGGTIRTFGDGAFGILAQSIGGGGGLLGDSTTGTLYAGPTGIPNGGNRAGNVTITQSGSITTSGTNSVAIFAQSSAAGNFGFNGGIAGTVTVNVNGSVTGGSGPQGAGIWVADGQYNVSPTNSIVVGSTGRVSAASGVAITYTGNQSVDVTNSGVITGSISVNRGIVTNHGTWSTGTNSVANVVNPGVLIIGSPAGLTRSNLVGNLTQTASGLLSTGTDFVNRRAGLLTVQGDAVLAGRVSPVLTTVLPNIALPILSVSGTISGALSGAPSSLFGYGVTRSGNTISLTATSANFNPPGYNLPDSRAATAGHLQAAWDRGGGPELGALFALLGNTADAGGAAAYSAQLRQLSPDSTFAPGARATAGAQNFANATLSCPQFEGTTAMLVEGNCGWMRITGRTASQSSGNGVSDFKLDTTTWQIGGQQQVAPGWFVGGSLAYENTWLSSTDGLNKGNGQAGFGALTVKYQTGPWLFAASAFGGAGQFNASRTITLPGFASIAKGSPDTSNMGVLLRAGYTIGREEFYLRPNISLSTIHVRTGAYRENGAGALNLSVDSAQQTTAMLTPMLEIGGRVALDDGMVLRPFLTAGISVLSNDAWKQTGRLTGAAPGTGGFTTTVPMDQVVGRVGAGVQLYTGKLMDFRLQYDGEYGGNLTAHGGSVVISVKF